MSDKAQGRNSLPVGAAADRLGVCVRTLRRWVADGRVAHHRTLGGHLRFPIAELKRLCEPRPNPDKPEQ